MLIITRILMPMGEIVMVLTHEVFPKTSKSSSTCKSEVLNLRSLDLFPVEVLEQLTVVKNRWKSPFGPFAKRFE